MCLAVEPEADKLLLNLEREMGFEPVTLRLQMQMLKGYAS